MASSSSLTLHEELIEIQQDLEKEEYEKGLERCKALLDNDLLTSNESIRDVVIEIHNHCCLVAVEDFSDSAIESMKSLLKDKKKGISELESYMEYRNKDFVKASKHAGNDENKKSLLCQHVKAQSLYRLHQTKQTLETYRDLLENSSSSIKEEQMMEILCNALAALVANATPCALQTQTQSSSWDSLAQTFVTRASDLLDSLSSSSLSDTMNDLYNDLAYNLGTFLLLQGHLTQGKQYLKMAQRSASPDSPEYIRIHINLALENNNLLTNTTTPSSSSNDDFALEINSSKSLSDFPSQIPPKATPLQRRLYYYNRAIYALHSQQYDVAKESCQSLLQSIQGNKKKKQTSSSIQVISTPTKEEDHWWKARVSVLEAIILLQQQNNIQSAIDLLEQRKNTLLAAAQATNSSDTRFDSALGLVQLQLSQLKQQQQSKNKEEDDLDSISLLKQNLAPSILQSKAVVATLASLYQQKGLDDEIPKLLQPYDSAMADFLYSQERFEEAAKLYAKEINSESTATTITNRLKYIQCLSFSDPTKAQTLWDELNLESIFDSSSFTIDGEQLEQQELPRFASTSTRDAYKYSSLSSQNKKRSKESIQRRRAKKRQAHIEKLKAAGTYNVTKPPNPERWLPKQERSNYRPPRRKVGRGAQGGISEREAAKLDVVGKAAGHYNTSGVASSAHISTATGNTKRKGGRRR